MKSKSMKKIIRIVTAIMITTVFMAGCTKKEDSGSSGQDTSQSKSTNIEAEEENRGQEGSKVTELHVQFGDDGTSFDLHLEDNQTAAAIAGYVGSSDWRLPIYEDDEDADYDVMQYYDIPDSYEISSEPETIRTAKAGDVFYSDPNRIVLFYRDAKISEQYTRIGKFGATDQFVTAVKENPVLEGWGNKIIHIAQP